MNGFWGMWEEPKIPVYQMDHTPFVYHERRIFQWAWFSRRPSVVHWNNIEWNLRESTGSTYYTPSATQPLPGMPDNEGFFVLDNKGMVKFKDMPIGTRFKCWGDVYSKYTTPTMITLEKTGATTATEVDEKDGRLGQHNSMSDDCEFWDRHIVRIGSGQ
jgi:hypothetical protein